MEQYSRTEFPRFEPDGGGGSVSTFFNKLLNLPAVFSSTETAPAAPPTTPAEGGLEATPVQPHEESLGHGEKEEVYDVSTGAVEGRSLQNVVRRISSLVAIGSTGAGGGGGTRYADTELARYWMPDDISRECLECEAKFSALRRRHHCRVCGQIFCSRCCSQRIPGQMCGCAGGLRVCTYCCKVVLSYLQERDMSGDIPNDLRTLQENLQVKFPERAAGGARAHDTFVLGGGRAADEEEPAAPARALHAEPLQDVFRHVAYALPTQQHRYRLVRYSNVWRGCDIMQWIMDNTGHTTRSQASTVCQGLLSEGYMECVTEQLKFADYALYRPTQPPDDPPSHHESGEASEPERGAAGAAERSQLAASVSSYCLDLNLGASSARLIRSPKCEERGSCSADEESTETPPQASAEQRWDNGAEEMGAEGQAGQGRQMSEAGREHLLLLMRKCLARESLPSTWLQVLFPLCLQATDKITPDLHGSEQDVRAYVQVKKASGGAPSDSRVVSGVVLSKNVAHRGMPRHLSQPHVLLLDCSIAYQRVEGKLTSLEPVLLQEQQYLVRMAARVLALRPGVVLTRGTVARAVQDELRAAGVALATCVRERALRRLARCLNADLLASVDSRIGTPRLGTCKQFYVENLSGKTVLVLEGCAEAELGCCVLLRGADVRELARVKRVVRFMLLACYNWRLERAFLADIGAVLPQPIPFTTNTHEGEQERPCEVEPANRESDGGAVARRSETDKTVSTGVVVRDLSDPLRAPPAASLAHHDDVFLSPHVPATTLTADTDANKWWAEDAALSMSPHVNIAAPFLETEAGRRCPLRQYFRRPLFRTPSTAPAAVTPRRDSPIATPKRQRSLYRESPHTLKEPHEFVRRALTASAEDVGVRASLAHYRALGARLNHDPAHVPDCPQWRPSVVRKQSTAAGRSAAEAGAGAGKAEEPDPLAPDNHQRLNLLIYSFSSKSANVPDFCVNPWIVRMEMYGRHDISLGAFLNKYCFNTEYRCPSRTCHAPMLHHIRRFVHGDGCITITCNTVGNSTGLQRPSSEHLEQMTWWSRCGWCAGAATRTERLSRAALSLSLAKYLELRLLAPRYTRVAACQHSLNHAHAHYFAKGFTTACFRYSKIKSWDIVLPPSVIRAQYDTRAMRDTLLQQANDLLLKGHEVFSAAGAGGGGAEGSAEGAERDYSAFKQHVEQLHSALTSAALRQHMHADVVRWLWSLCDGMVAGERLVRDAQERYAAPANPPPASSASASAAAPTNKLLRALHDATAEEKSDAEDSIPEGGTDSAETASRSDVEHTGGEEDEERGDRKTVRAILSQLLSNSQPANQAGIIISGGVLPVVVFAGQVGSVIAAGLASVQYRQQLQLLLQHQSQTGSTVEQEESVETKDKSEEARGKTSKCSDHIEVLLKDGLLCRVYYAAQFQKLRELLLAPLSADNVTDAFSQASGAATPPPEDEPRGDSDNDREREDISGHRRTASSCGRRWAGPGGTGLCDVEEGFVRSLAHCVAWTARGGKSGSTFCKTKDDRYVLKEMSKQEWQQFLEFAPHYFNYVFTCHNNRLPTLLARIVGVYSVGGAGNGVLVMENLFYEHGADLTHRFDLKGASRNRLAADTAHPDAVLMDENLLNMRWETPLYVQAHTAEVLWAGVERDTEFLASHSVMDYSLLLGVDSQHNCLILGIIDYIRTFTWDKKLEHLVKKNLGSGQPTIVSPAQYRDRFCAAAAKYFLHAPNRWDGLHLGLASDTHT